MERFELCYGCMEPIDENTEVCPHCGYHIGAPYLPSYLAPGTRLSDRYIIGKLKSYNGESAVYAAYDTITETKVYIKEYMPDSLCKREKGSCIITVEANSVARYKTLLSEFVELNKILSKMRTLNHINATIDMFGDNNTAYAVFGWLEGQTLGEYLKMNAGELTWEEVKKLFSPIFTTLSLVHNAGIVHRGLSPENILVTEKGELKLTGFCIADERTANTELVPEIYSGYAAPEQYNSSNWQGTWTDVYGISALLYRTLTGVVPTDALSRMSEDDLIEPAEINHNIPRNVSKVIMNGMCLNGELRIQTVTELVTQLFEQPDYGSVRLSSSSTQTITVPKQKASGKKKKDLPSRHGLFIAIIAIILSVGIFFLIMVLILSLDDSSGGYKRPPALSVISGSEVTTTMIGETGTSGTDTGGGAETVIPSEGEEITPSITTMTFPESTGSPMVTGTTEESNVMVYVMNDLTGKNYDIISKSDTYSNLVFTPEYEYNDEYPKGQIYGQSIPKDETYEDGAEITVNVSLGPKFIEIPDHIAMTKKDYFAKLDSLGIKYQEKEYLTEDMLEGYVYDTDKKPGEQIDVEQGEILTVYIAKNPPKTEATTVTEPPVTDNEPEETSSEETTVITDEPDIIITIYD